MQTEEPKQFRLNPQVLIVATVALLALALPIAFVIASLQTAFSPKRVAPSPAAEAETAAPLQKALEEIADKSLNPAVIEASSDREIVLLVEDPEGELARVEALAKALDAVSLPAARDDKQIRLRVSLGDDQSSTFIKACHEKTLPPQTKSTGPARAMIEVVIRKKNLP